jgi:uncharacterized membrane protein YjfL (UPF0719 family)
MGIEGLTIGLILSLIQLIVGLALAMGSVYLGLRMFDKLTEGIDELAELKKGNVAVAILLGAIVFSIANVVQVSVMNLTRSLTIGMPVLQLAIGIIVGLIHMFIGIVLAVISIYIAVRILDKITVGIDEFKELKKGNVAVAILMAAVLFAVSYVIGGVVSAMAAILSPQNVAYSFGWL